MSYFTIKIDEDIELKENVVSFLLCDVKWSLRAEEIVASVHDNKGGDTSRILRDAHSNAHRKEPSMWSTYGENMLYVQSAYYTGLQEENEDNSPTFENIMIEGNNKTIHIMVDSIPALEPGDDLVLCEKFNIRLGVSKRITADVLVRLFEGLKINMGKVTQKDVKKLKETEYFHDKTANVFTLETEDKAIHFKG